MAYTPWDIKLVYDVMIKKDSISFHCSKFHPIFRPDVLKEICVGDVIKCEDSIVMILKWPV